MDEMNIFHDIGVGITDNINNVNKGYDNLMKKFTLEFCNLISKYKKIFIYVEFGEGNNTIDTIFYSNYTEETYNIFDFIDDETIFDNGEFDPVGIELVYMNSENEEIFNKFINEFNILLKNLKNTIYYIIENVNSVEMEPDVNGFISVSFEYLKENLLLNIDQDLNVGNDTNNIINF